MLFHIGIFIWLLISVLAGLKINKKYKLYKLNYIISVLIFFIYSFLRWERGTDWIPYYSNFISNRTFYEYYTAFHFEKGFQILNYIFKLLTNNYTVFLFFQALIIQVLFSVTIYKNLKNPIVGIFLMYCFSLGNMYFVRSTLALSIIFFSIKYIKEEEKFKFLLMILFASTIHITALFFIPAIYIYKVKISKFLYIFILIFGVIFGVLFFKDLVLIVFKLISPHRVIYLSKSNSILKIFINIIIPRIIFIGYFLFSIDFKENSNKEIIGYFNLYFCGVMLSIVLSTINPELLRLSNVFEIFNLLLFPQIFILKKNKVIIFLVFLIYFSLKFYSILFGQYKALYMPLKTIFNKEKLIEIF